jgi:UvrD/REP helicase N-terminal domain/UvrD-like helicase C-terminal domain
MEFRIADTFTDALARLTAQEQRAAKTTAFDLQMDPSAPGLQFHRIDKSKDPYFWSIRVNRDLRIIVHKTASSFLLAYVDHHDDAYAWAARRRIEAHPKTGAIQIVEVRERVEEIAPVLQPKAEIVAPVAPPLFETLSSDDLLAIGVPGDWINDVRRASEDSFFDLATHLPAEAAEALLEYATTGMLHRPAPPPVHADPFAHPDALRRFRVVENVEELQRALEYPWEKWTVFLHPSQREIVERDFDGPAHVAGSAGTGKTIVALHRAARLAQSSPQSRVLLTTFSRPLATALAQKLKILVGEGSSVIPKIVVIPFRGVAEELYQLVTGRRQHAATEDQVRRTLSKAAKDRSVTEFTARFLFSEWTYVVDAWQLDSAKAYADVPRLGRKNRLGAKQRARLWPIFEATRDTINRMGLHTWAQIVAEVTTYYSERKEKPFSHIVVDEAQDLGVPELRLLVAIAPAGTNALFFAGDLGQRIFQQPFSWTTLGVDLRGYCQTLKVNYRTSHQIRQAADRLLPDVMRDVDGREEQRFGTVSIFNGPEPLITTYPDVAAEASAVGHWISQAIADGIKPAEIGIFVRTHAELDRARTAAATACHEVLELSERGEDPAGRVSIGIMHLAKGLEFKAVAVIACDDEVLPLQSRIEAVADEVELDDVYETERQLFYVACTRARDRLWVSGISPASEFLNDLRSTAAIGSAPRSPAAGR